MPERLQKVQNHGYVSKTYLASGTRVCRWKSVQQVRCLLIIPSLLPSPILFCNYCVPHLSVLIPPSSLSRFEYRFDYAKLRGLSVFPPSVSPPILVAIVIEVCDNEFNCQMTHFHPHNLWIRCSFSRTVNKQRFSRYNRVQLLFIIKRWCL